MAKSSHRTNSGYGCGRGRHGQRLLDSCSNWDVCELKANLDPGNVKQKAVKTLRKLQSESSHSLYNTTFNWLSFPWRKPAQRQPAADYRIDNA
jgi:hypothetical protein